MSKLVELLNHGQSVWLDYIDRDLVSNGGLNKLVAEGVRGVTSNPSIFQKAITGSDDYDPAIRQIVNSVEHPSVDQIYEHLTVEDVQRAADILHSVYTDSGKVDGFVSLEVSPHLAHDTEQTILAARHLWARVARPNLMIKVPATIAGLAAIEQLISEGINVNVTLLFSVQRYVDVFHAYIRGLEKNENPADVASVASFFISRIDAKIDPALDAFPASQTEPYKGKTAIDSAKTAYARFKEIAASDAFQRQIQRGARVQRLLWGSTSTKNPAYSDVVYVDQLIGADTVNTLPPNTLQAFQNHGTVANTLETETAMSINRLKGLDEFGINLDQVTDQLEIEGVAAFAASYDELLECLRKKAGDLTEDIATT
jgi:transaldolase